MERLRYPSGIGLAAVIAALALGACGGSSHPQATGTANAAASATTATGSPPATSTGGASAVHPGRGKSQAKAKADPRPKGGAAKISAHAGQVPAGAVATVAGQPISLTVYHRAYAAQLKSLSSGQIPLDPPTYTRCVAAYRQMMRKLQAHLPKKAKAHLPTPSHAQLLKNCRARYQGIRQSVMAQLIEQQWTLGAARADGIHVSAAQVDHALSAQEKAIGGPKAYAKYLKRAGQTRSQLAATTRLGLINEALQKRRLGPPAHVTQAQVAAFFHAHHAEFVLPHHKTPKLATYAPRIRLLLQEQVQSRRAEAANLAYEHHWRAQTVCAPGYVVSLCANGPR